jgi:hypothetical protein
VIDAIWSDMGLRYPPAVAPLSRKATATVARANRLSIRLANRTQDDFQSDLESSAR